MSVQNLPSWLLSLTCSFPVYLELQWTDCITGKYKNHFTNQWPKAEGNNSHIYLMDRKCIVNHQCPLLLHQWLYALLFLDPHKSTARSHRSHSENIVPNVKRKYILFIVRKWLYTGIYFGKFS